MKRKRGPKPKPELTEPKKNINELTKDAEQIIKSSGWIKGAQDNSEELFDSLIEKAIKDADKKEKE